MVSCASPDKPLKRLFAWLFNFHRLVRYEYHAEYFQGFLHLGAAIILLRHSCFMRWVVGQAVEKLKASLRVFVEHPFRSVKSPFGIGM